MFFEAIRNFEAGLLVVAMRPAPASLPDPWKKAPKRPDRKSLRRPHRRSKPQLLTSRDLDKRSNAYKMFTQLTVEIENDLGGRDALSTIERTMISAYVGAAVSLQHLNTQLALGQKVDLTTFSGAASTMVRIASRLGLRRRSREVESIDEYLKRTYAIAQDTQEPTP
jgi:hypothetical protein